MLACTFAIAGDAENIGSCVKKAKDLAKVVLDPFAVTYDGKILSMSTAKWSNAFCEVKFSDVYTLQIDGRDVVYKGYTGRASFELNQRLQAKTTDAINQLNSRIALLQQRASQVSVSLKLANPNHPWLEQYVDEGIQKSTGKPFASENILSNKLPSEPPSNKLTSEPPSPVSPSALSLPMEPRPLSVPSDPGATYWVLSVEKASNNDEVYITTQRKGKSGVSFAKRLVNCNYQTFRYVGDADTFEELQRQNLKGKMGALVQGSISWYASQYACAHAIK